MHSVFTFALARAEYPSFRLKLMDYETLCKSGLLCKYGFMMISGGIKVNYLL